EGWELAASVEQRRALLKSACALHRRMGTKWSIVRALGILGLDADIEEWFEYGGEPHYFRVIIDGTDSGAPDLARAIRTALEWKNARSHLEVVRIRLRAQAPVHVSAAAQFAHTIHVGPQIDARAEPAPCRLAARAAACAETIVSVYPARSFGRYDVSVQALAIPCVAGVAVVEQVSTGALQ
ncbi:MAG: phage tail protein, partial [Rhodocyclaceae bacterium]|nr:phage tail protein [Rhodocyclaceae bacterium]